MLETSVVFFWVPKYPFFAHIPVFRLTQNRGNFCSGNMIKMLFIMFYIIVTELLETEIAEFQIWNSKAFPCRTVIGLILKLTVSLSPILLGYCAEVFILLLIFFLSFKLKKILKDKWLLLQHIFKVAALVNGYNQPQYHRNVLTLKLKSWSKFLLVLVV